MAVITYKDEEAIEIMKEGAQILGKAHAEVAKLLDVGVSTMALDKVAEEFIRDNGGVPSFKNYNKFPASLCISMNECVVHGIPSSYELQNGDVASIDCGVHYKGYHTDSAYSYIIGDADPEVQKLLEITKKSLYQGIAQAINGNRTGDIGHAVQSFVEKEGFSVVRELVGHGVGRNLHEKPDVPNYGRRGRGAKLKTGMVIAIEPMINLGTKNVTQLRDGWSIITADHKPSAHFEHTVAIQGDTPTIITTFEYIESVLNKK